ncbi:tol-pal system protein YbgF [Brackiella oedipodis]|uniref:tol-pal system protein YbgF n=1 Tax=Brackiella oedipodis TaxID=124225 RepID=UPI00048B7153|nr:tol-pal system protein YbgF [Brackiella oedipodis]
MLKHKVSFLAVSAAMLLGMSQQALAAEDEDARRAVLELRSQLKMANQSRMELSNQIRSLQDDVAKLTGQVQALSHAAKQQARPADTEAEPNPQVGDPDQQDDYDAALDLFRQGNYSESAQALHEFVSRYPNTPLTSSAMFYEGSSRYASRDFGGAINTLNQMISRYPKDEKAGDAMLVIAGSQLEQNDIAASKTTLKNIIAKYPNSPASDTAQERLKMYK